MLIDAIICRLYWATRNFPSRSSTARLLLVHSALLPLPLHFSSFLTLKIFVAEGTAGCNMGGNLWDRMRAVLHGMEHDRIHPQQFPSCTGMLKTSLNSEIVRRRRGAVAGRPPPPSLIDATPYILWRESQG